MAAALAMTAVTAAAEGAGQVSLVSSESDYNIETVKPSYLDDAFGGAIWGNWFLSVHGGMSVFSGMPVGHSDFFDRSQPMLSAALGKWMSPYFGARIAFQGFELTDADRETRKYQNIHLDVLYNIAAHFRSDRIYLPRWTFAPFAGTGVIHNAWNGNKPFALSYGLLLQYRVARRLNIGIEVANTMTWRDFDGRGDGSYLGDNLIQASAGLSLTLGKVGWTRVIDAKPYIEQNDILQEYVNRLRRENELLKCVAETHDKAISDMKNILATEGRTAQYEGLFDECGTVEPKNGPKNSYSGLNALRARMKMKEASIASDSDSVAVNVNGQYYKDIADGKIAAGAPIYFFFKKGTTTLTESAQVINIREVAKAIRENDLAAEIIGAADSDTGTPEINEELSKKRADAIIGMLVSEGAPRENLKGHHVGGIAAYAPLEGNRNSCILLHAKQKE